MDVDELPPISKYHYSRETFRDATREKTLGMPHVLPLINVTSEYVVRTMFVMSGKNVTHIKGGLYISKLVVSFVRTHFIAIDLALQGELVEAATLVRKQLELLARLNELIKVEDVDSLLKRTPNLSSLRTRVKALYGSYSEIAHSSTTGPLQLLGRTEVDGAVMTNLYPEYSDYALTCLQHIALCVFEYFLWADKFFTENFHDYDATWASDWASHAFKVHDDFLEALP